MIREAYYKRGTRKNTDSDSAGDEGVRVGGGIGEVFTGRRTKEVCNLIYRRKGWRKCEYWI